MRPAIERVGGAPVVIKLLEGTQGIGVILAPSNRVAEAIVETLHSTQQNVLIQEFIAESKGRDIRALVVGDRVVAAMRRTAQGDEFRSNVHRGGSAESVAISPEYERTAVRAAQIMGLRVAGVDMLEGADGPLVMEVNSSPGLEGIETATGLDVAGAIIDYVANQVAFPELDVRQRLSVSTGYGVAELLVREDAELVGTTIRESGLRERDITVLTLHRGTEVIPNPRESRELEANDRLLCFGKLESMRDMIPARTQAQGTRAQAARRPARRRGAGWRVARSRKRVASRRPSQGGGCMKFGRFDDERREYVITRPDTPLPWINYLGSEDYLGLISNTAGGYSFYQDARLRRLTRYRYNNAPLDIGGRYVYVRDDDSGTLLEPQLAAGRPGRGRLRVPPRHGLHHHRLPHRGRSTPRPPTSCRWARTWRCGAHASPTSATPRPTSRSSAPSSGACGTPTTTPPTSSATTPSARSRSTTASSSTRPSTASGAITSPGSPAARSWPASTPSATTSWVPTVAGTDRWRWKKAGHANSIAHGWQPIGSHHVRLELAPGETREVIFALGYAENPSDDKFDPPGSQTINKARVRPLIEKYTSRR